MSKDLEQIARLRQKALDAIRDNRADDLLRMNKQNRSIFSFLKFSRKNNQKIKDRILDVAVKLYISDKQIDTPTLRHEWAVDTAEKLILEIDKRY